MTEEAYQPPSCLPPFAERVFSKSEIATVLKAGQSTVMESVKGSCSRKRQRCTAASCGAMKRPVGVSCTAESEGERGVVARRAWGAGYCTEGEMTDSGESSADERGGVVLPMIGSITAAAAAQISLLHSQPTALCGMGTAFRMAHFSITPDVVFINHGAFGSALSGAMFIKRLYESHMEEEVVAFVDRELLPLIVYSIRSLSRFIHADPRQVVLLQNATFALNCAARMISKDDVVAFLDIEYLAVYKIIWYRCEEVGAALHEISVNQFLHNEDIMGDDAALTAEICRQLPPNCTTMIVDYVSSTSALCLPLFTHVIPALRQRGVSKIIVDGAHAPLQLDLNFASLPPESQPTVFIGNLHKWFSSPKSAGFFWVRRGDADQMRSVVLSHGAGEGLLSEFIWDGTRDYGAYLSIPAIVNFWEQQGCDRVRGYCSQLLLDAAQMLTAAFNSRRVARHSPFMTLVELPEELQDDVITGTYIQDLLHDIFKVEVPVKRIEERFYLRISAFVYNTPAEYLYLREAVLWIAKKWIASPERVALLQKRAEELNRLAAAGATGEVVPCDERIRRQGGCGVSGLDPSKKRKKTSKFS